MKQPVKYSTYCHIFTCAVAGAVIALLLLSNNTFAVTAVVCIAAALMLTALCYAPLYISADDKCIRIHRVLRSKSIPLSDITDISPCPPTLGTKTVCGSPGFFGYWGWFSERDLGKYFAYYGRSSQCFLLTLRNGQKYILGCSNPDDVIQHIRKHIDKTVR